MDLLIGFVIWLMILGVVLWLLFKYRKGLSVPKYKTCPSCLEKIKQDADICGFCGKAQKKEENEQRVHGEKMKTLKSTDSQELSKLNI